MSKKNKKNKPASHHSKDKKPAGQPSKYAVKYVGMLLKYFDVAPYKTVTIDKLKVKSANDLPMLEGFAKKIGISRQTLYNWSTAADKDGNLLHPEIADAIARAKDAQAVILVTNGLHGLYSGSSWIFTAKNVLGWRDNVDLTSGGDKLSEVEKYTYLLPGFEIKKEET